MSAGGGGRFVSGGGTLLSVTQPGQQQRDKDCDGCCQAMDSGHRIPMMRLTAAAGSAGLVLDGVLAAASCNRWIAAASVSARALSSAALFSSVAIRAFKILVCSPTSNGLQRT